MTIYVRRMCFYLLWTHACCYACCYWDALLRYAISYGFRFACVCVCISEAMTTRLHNHMNFVPQSHTHERAWRWHNFQSICEFSIVTTTIASITNTNRCNINLITLRERWFSGKNGLPSPSRLLACFCFHHSVICNAFLVVEAAFYLNVCVEHVSVCKWSHTWKYISIDVEMEREKEWLSERMHEIDDGGKAARDIYNTPKATNQ